MFYLLLHHKCSLVLVFCSIISVSVSKESKKPNIIFILTDDQGYADVGFTNPDSPFVTENVDKLAANAIRLDNFYVHPTCTPTRAALLTGRYAANVGLGLAFVPGNPGGLEPQFATLADQFATMGYTNHLVGKWHLGNSKKLYHPLNRGFHSFYGVLGGGLNSWNKQGGSGRYDFWDGFEPHWDNVTHVTDLFNHEAVRIIENHGKTPDSSPFFLYLAHTAPHDPLLPHPRHLQKCQHIKNRARRLSCGMVAGIDEGVGKIVETLKRHGMFDNTIIAYSHDNGGVPYAGALNYPLRGGKATAYEGGSRSPGFVHAPKLLPRSRNHQGLFHVSDYFPTLVSMVSEMSGEKQNISVVDPSLLDGVDQLEALKKGTKVRENVHIHRDFVLGVHVYRKGDWKLIVGNHEAPFIFPLVFEEPSENGDWLYDNGKSLTGKIFEMFLHFTDLVIGEENYLFFKYALWFRYNSHMIGGFQNWPFFGRTGTDGNIYSPPVKSNLEELKKKHQDVCPKVSLFNLESDPHENENLADKYPELVLELLAEAEDAVKDASPEVVGNLVQKGAPAGPQADTWWETIFARGTTHTEVIPFGPYLEDDVDISKLEYKVGFMENIGIMNIIFLFLWVFVSLLLMILLPILMARLIMKRM